MNGRLEHPLVTFFRHGCNVWLAVAILALTVALAAQGSFSAHLSWVARGLGIFVISEYLMHRYLLHARPSRHPFIYSLQRRLHYDHHVEPTRLDLLFAPLWFGIPLVLSYGLAYYLLSHSLTITLSLLLGNLAGILYYEHVHYVAHIPVTPRTPWGRWMKKYHLLHHYKNEHYWFGVTNPGGDLVGGTYGDVRTVDKSGTTKHLF